VKILSRIRTFFVEGLVFVVPIFLTVYILSLALKLIFGQVSSAFLLVPEAIEKNPYFHFGLQILFLAGSLIFLIVIGLAAQTIFGKTLGVFIRNMIEKIPVVSTVFSTVKDFVFVLFSGKSEIFSHPVIIEYPFKGRKAIGFNTGSFVIENSKKRYCTVYIPTVPFPTTGFTYIVEEKEITPLDYDTESVIKMIFSAGILTKAKKIKKGPLTDNKQVQK